MSFYRKLFIYFSSAIFVISVAHASLDVEEEAIIKKYFQQKKYQEAIKRLELLAKKGDSEAQYLIGMTYLNKKKDPIMAVKWLEQAATNGHISAQFELGKALVNPKSIKSNESAITWVKKAAMQGNAQAQKLI